jgi:plasmid maintenance system killer protein
MSQDEINTRREIQKYRASSRHKTFPSDLADKDRKKLDSLVAAVSPDPLLEIRILSSTVDKLKRHSWSIGGNNNRTYDAIVLDLIKHYDKSK